MVPPLMWKLSHVAVLSCTLWQFGASDAAIFQSGLPDTSAMQKNPSEMKVFRQGKGVPFLIQLVEVSDSAHTCKERSKSNCI